MADEEKHMDVAKPGTTNPDTGSKPMVVGHKIMKDPTVKEEKDSEKPKETAKEKEEKKLPSQKKITLKPIEKSPEEKKKAEAEADTTAKSDVDGPSETTKKTDEEEPKTDSDKAKDKVNERYEKEEKLQELIKSKKYYVNIHESSSSPVQTFLITFIVVAIIGAIGLVLLIDAEILDLNIDLPFDFL